MDGRYSGNFIDMRRPALCRNIAFRPEGPVSVYGSHHYQKIGFVPCDFNFAELTFGLWLATDFYALQKYGTDQTIVQRYLTAKTDRDAKKRLTSE